MKEHIVKTYDGDLKKLHRMITQMGNLVQQQLGEAIHAVIERDSALAEQVVSNDAQVDVFEHEIDAFAVRLLALRQPVASDLRHVIAALKISSHLERVGDYVINIARRSILLNSMTVVPSIYIIPRMGQLTLEMLQKVLISYTEADHALALEVWKKDADVDTMYNGLFRELLTYMLEDPHNITSCTHLLFIARDIERIGDHLTNVAEAVHYLLQGTPFKEPSPRHHSSDA